MWVCTFWYLLYCSGNFSVVRVRPQMGANLAAELLANYKIKMVYKIKIKWLRYGIVECNSPRDINFYFT